MGRYYWDKKDTVEDCRTISISFLRKFGYFDCSWPQGIVWTNRNGEQTAGMTVSVHTSQDENYIRLLYTMTDRNTGKETHFDYKVELETTPCNLGGVRWWFICPLSRNGVYCGRRVGVLYQAPWADYYGCRHCYDLSYESRNEARHSQLVHMRRYMTLSTRLKKLWGQTNRLIYRGIPTKRIQRLFVLDARLDAYGKTHLADLLGSG
jgi:hypothetical protein